MIPLFILTNNASPKWIIPSSQVRKNDKRISIHDLPLPEWASHVEQRLKTYMYSVQQCTDRRNYTLRDILIEWLHTETTFKARNNLKNIWRPKNSFNAFPECLITCLLSKSMKIKNGTKVTVLELAFLNFFLPQNGFIILT